MCKKHYKALYKNKEKIMLTDIIACNFCQNRNIEKNKQEMPKQQLYKRYKYKKINKKR